MGHLYHGELLNNQRVYQNGIPPHFVQILGFAVNDLDDHFPNGHPLIKSVGKNC
jgi:hypothetical protein